jgi:hypothetical protein
MSWHKNIIGVLPRPCTNLIYKILEKTPTEATDYADLIRAIRKISSSVVYFSLSFFPGFP